eukprot:1145462-Pelagomonas_calceolata.AAC.2
MQPPQMLMQAMMEETTRKGCHIGPSPLGRCLGQSPQALVAAGWQAAAGHLGDGNPHSEGPVRASPYSQRAPSSCTAKPSDLPAVYARQQLPAEQGAEPVHAAGRPCR